MAPIFQNDLCIQCMLVLCQDDIRDDILYDRPCVNRFTYRYSYLSDRQHVTVYHLCDSLETEESTLYCRLSHAIDSEYNKVKLCGVGKVFQTWSGSGTSRKCARTPIQFIPTLFTIGRREEINHLYTYLQLFIDLYFIILLVDSMECLLRKLNITPQKTRWGENSICDFTEINTLLHYC